MNGIRLGVTEDRREKIAQAAAAVGALLIVVSLFLPWYSLGLSDSVKGLAEAGVQEQIESADLEGEEAERVTDLIDTSVDYSGWSSLEFADAFLLFVAVAALLFVLRRQRPEASARPREDDDRLFLFGLLAVIAVLVLLFTKNSPLGMLGSTVDFAQDRAAEFDVPRLEVLAISPDIGLWIGLLGSLAILVAGVFHSLVNIGGAPRSAADAPTQVAPTGTTATGAPPPPRPGGEGPGTGPPGRP